MCSLKCTIIEFIVKISAMKKIPVPDDFIGVFCQTSKDEVLQILMKQSWSWWLLQGGKKSYSLIPHKNTKIFKNISKSNWINMKEYNYVIIAINAEKLFDEIQHSFSDNSVTYEKNVCTATC